MGYTIVFKNVLIMLFYLFCGWGLVKADKSESNHARSFSGLLIYVCGPAMVLNAFQGMAYSAENNRRLLLFFLMSLAVQLLFFLLLWVLLRKKYADAKYRILSAGAVLGNVGFFGLPLVRALFPMEEIVACYSMMYITSMNLLIFTLGAYLITQNKKFISLRSAILNPTTLTMLVALPLYYFQIHFPPTMGSIVSLLGTMTTPLCMVVLGMRLASMRFMELFNRPFAYAACGLKLVVFPLFAYLVACVCPGLDETFRICLMVLSATPSASVILSMAELHRCERELSANVVLLTTLLCVVTLPVLMWIVQR